MKLSKQQKETLLQLRCLIHDDELDCENVIALIEIQFPKMPKELERIDFHLRLRALYSKLAIDTLRTMYKDFM